MSREFKFRVYDKKLKEYIEWNSIIPFDSDEYEIEQYTCYKDKNGTPIYEGDKMKFKHAEHFVEFKDGSFVIGGLNVSDYAFDWGLHKYVDYLPDCEVVGNRYVG
jgi:hypothetical protein